MDPHLAAPVRSLPTHSPSPSHSASASATSSLHKRKRKHASPHAPPFSDDLESISGRNNNSSSSPSSSEEVVDEDEDDYDATIHTFNSSRLENSGNVSARSNAKLKRDNLVKIESVGGPAGLVVKEDNVKSIFTENIQTSGAYSAREDNLKREEEAGQLKFACVGNDGIDEHMVNRIEEHLCQTTAKYAKGVHCSSCDGQVVFCQ